MRALIAAGGEVLDVEAVRRWAPPADHVIAADSGLAHLHAIGRTAHMVVGDLDSVEQAQLEEAIASGVAVQSSPTDKNETDLELAVDVALGQGCTELFVIGALGGRIDHALANIGLLAARASASGCHIEAYDGSRRLWFVTRHVDLSLPPGSPIALLPWHGPATGVSSTGVQWPLAEATLPAGSPRGISNVCTDPTQTVTVRRGVLVVVHDPLAFDG